MNPLRLKVVEIVGLHLGSYGRTCEIHNECGRSVKVGDLVVFRQERVAISEEIETSKDIEQPTISKVSKSRKKKVPQVKVKTFKIRTEQALKVYLWATELQKCAIGFVSKTFISIYTMEALDGQIAEITSVHSPFECELARSEELNGLARATILGISNYSDLLR
jgi:hypothetical protein